MNSIILHIAPKTTSYSGNYIYEGYGVNDADLQFFNHPEGYVEPTDNPTRPYIYINIKTI